MPTLWPNLKKCLALNFVGLSVCFFDANPSLGFPKQNLPLRSQILAEIQIQKNAHFDSLIQSWTQRFGNELESVLVDISYDQKLDDIHRTIAIGALAQKHNPLLTKHFVALSKNSSWMIRDISIKALAKQSDKSAFNALVDRLFDPALVVRSTALHAALELKIPDMSTKLIEVIFDKNNYHHQKALWIVYDALEGLTLLNAKQKSTSLKALLSHSNDPELLRKTIFTLEKLTSVALEPKGSLTDKTLAWKNYLLKIQNEPLKEL